MPIPTVYSEPLLQQYMLNQTGNLGVVLELDVTDFIEAVADTLLAYGVTGIANATDIAKLRALAKVEAWRVAKAHAAGRTDFDVESAALKRSQLIAQVQMFLDMAEADALLYGLSNYRVTVGALVYSDDPYPLPSDETS